jgi:predicted DCC family thiol-disulfide oxidoreductase YuxK
MYIRDLCHTSRVVGKMKTMQDRESITSYWPKAIEKPIVFFDGECVMCSGFVDLLLKIDPSIKMHVAPLQGETARQLLPPLPNSRAEWSIFYKDKTHLYQESDAFIHICQRLGGLWSVFSLILLIPRPIRDGIYRMVARNRYRAFGRRSTCRMPSEQEKNRFLP